MTPQLLGFFDSGLGGLTVLRRVLERHGSVPCVYLGDTARVPYGNRQPDDIRRIAAEVVGWLRDQQVSTVVMACNTTNALSMNRPDVNGIETFFFSDPRSGRLASYLQQQMMDVSPGTPNRGVRRGRFFVIRRSTMPSALVEMGFVTGAIDAPRLAKADHRRRLALALAAGILNYLKQEVR